MALRPVYSSRLLAWSDDESPAPFVVPVGYVCVVRDVDVWFGGGALVAYELQIEDFARFWGGQFTVESVPQIAQWRGRQVLNESEILVFSSDGATDGIVSGYLLLSP